MQSLFRSFTTSSPSSPPSASSGASATHAHRVPPSLPILPAHCGFIPNADLVIKSVTLGTGRFGNVLQAEWLGSAVAVKRIVPAAEVSHSIRHALEKEVSLLVALLAHPNVLPLYGITNCDAGSIYLVSKLCAGGSLKKRVHDLREAGGVISQGEFFHVARSIASGLCFIHDKGLVYRDLKSGNILLGLGEDRERNSILLDAEFGIVRCLLDEIAALHTRTSPKTGHNIDSAYMSPELFRTEPPSAAGDIYSFAMVLYEIVTGWPPYRTLGMPDLLKCLVGKVRLPIPAHVPGSVADLIRECWDEDAANRPTARTLLLKLSALESQLTREGPAWPTTPADAAAVTIAVPHICIKTGLAVAPKRAGHVRASLLSAFALPAVEEHEAGRRPAAVE
jgi:serine/threonine protein kinase